MDARTIGKKRVICYCRVSTDKQDISVEVQKEKLTAYCALFDFEIVAIYSDEGFSAKSMNRPALKNALKLLEKNEADGIVIAKLDRLTRSLKDLATLLENFFASKYSLISINEQIDTSTASGRLVLNLLTSTAQFEREVLVERTKSAIQHLKSQNRRYTNIAPYGYSFSKSGKMVPNPQEQEVISVAKTLKVSGLSFHAVAKTLVEKGYRNRKNNVFTTKTVISMLKQVA